MYPLLFVIVKYKSEISAISRKIASSAIVQSKKTLFTAAKPSKTGVNRRNRELLRL